MNQRGSAMLIVLALLTLIGAMVIVNGQSLHAVHNELRRLNQTQQQHWQSKP